MGNGPSLNQMDLNLFASEHVWISNRGYLLFDRVAWRPSFYVSVDRRVLPDIAGEVNQLVRANPRLTCFFPVQYGRQRLIEPCRNVYWYNELRPRNWDDRRETVSCDASIGVSEVRTVTVAALQLAVYLGFDPIYLIGCDTSYTVPQTVVYDDTARQCITSTRDDDPNHFDARYFGVGRKWHEPHADKMIVHYRHVRETYDPDGSRIFNATVGGRLEVFPRVEYTRVFANKKGR
jgi:hypothetical protein